MNPTPSLDKTAPASLTMGLVMVAGMTPAIVSIGQTGTGAPDIKAPKERLNAVNQSHRKWLSRLSRT